MTVQICPANDAACNELPKAMQCVNCPVRKPVVVRGEVGNTTPPPVAGDVAQLMAKEYVAWIDFYHRGGDYDGFLKTVFTPSKQEGV